MEARLAIGTMVAGRYEVRACIGIGGMGEVYEVVDRRSDEAIALKTLRAVAHALVGSYGERSVLHRARNDALQAGWLALPILRSPLVQGTLAWTRASLELACGRTDIRRWLARLRKNPARGMTGLADLFAGHAALLAGGCAAARRLGAAAELALVANDMPLFAASARWLIDPATWPSWRASLAQAGVVDPERFVRVVAPALR